MDEVIQSEQIDQLCAAMLKFQEAAEDPARTKTAKVQTKNGRGYSFSYADLEDILPTCRTDLAKCGVWISQLPMGGSLVTQLTHSSGQWIRARYDLGLSPDATAQERGSAQTYARRYSIMAVLGLVAEEDDDGNAASGNTAEITAKPIIGASEGFVAKAEKAVAKIKTVTLLDAAIAKQQENIAALPEEWHTKLQNIIATKRAELGG